MKVFTGINQLMSLKGAVAKEARSIVDKDLSVIKNAAMVVDKGVVQWVGAESKLPEKYSSFPQKNLNGLNVFPGFVDCHTHMVFAGDRKDEFELRNQGVSYQEIARKGGGILSTMKATRRASLDDLTEKAQQRVNHHLNQGVTTIEVKSGYGLKKNAELKMLKAARSLKKAKVVTTFLGAHAIPKEFSSEKEYLKSLVVDLAEVKKEKLAHRVDIFIEKGYFTYKEAKKYLTKAQQMGFDLCIHADQMSHSKATQLAVEMEALSADHAICLTKKDKNLLAQSETTAVLLPCADFYLQCDYPDARGLIDQGARVALATDYNPGSSPTQSLPLLGVLSRLQMKMSLSEVFVAMTLGGAFALGLGHRVGALVPGFEADFFVSSSGWKDFFYDMSPMNIQGTYVRGVKQSV